MARIIIGLLAGNGLVLRLHPLVTLALGIVSLIALAASLEYYFVGKQADAGPR